MKDAWFRWEREAAIHLLFPTLEGSMGQLKDYVGFGFPTTILIFKDGVVTWCMKESEFFDLGGKLREIYVDPAKEKVLVADLATALQELQTVEKAISTSKLEKLDNAELLLIYQQLYQNFLKYYAIGAISTPLSFETEDYLRRHLKLTDEELQKLTSPDQDSYIKTADNYLLNSKDIAGFMREYFWINNSYSSTSVLTTDEVRSRLAELQKSKTKKVTDGLTSKISLSNDDVRLVELLKNYSIYKDDRKENILRFLSYFETVLAEVAKRSGWSIVNIRNIFPGEVEAVLNKLLDLMTVQKRKKFCVVVWEKDAKKPVILDGKKALEWEKKTLPKLSLTKILKGNVASQGKVVGKVRILLSSDDCDKLIDGEVLVTFMTSPDFMPAIRRSSAIVTNLGGVTSHAAIISRELGIPCIVGTKVATQMLKTGDLVEVDANVGQIRILKNAN